MDRKSIILYLIGVETGPNFVMRKAFQQHFDVLADYDWLAVTSQIGQRAMHEQFLQLLRQHRPEYCFMQIQNPGAMDAETIRQMANYTKIIHWTGDVRHSAGWYDWLAAIGREVYLTLFTNETDVAKLQARNVRADYLQIGFDNVYFGRRPVAPGWPQIVFLANCYDHFELSAYRVETVHVLRETFGHRFQVYGAGWQNQGIDTQPLNHHQEAICYSSCKLAISISNYCYERYYSDRLLRIMACGACALSHDFPGLEKDFTPGEDLVTFTDHRQLIDRCRYYLENDDERRNIAQRAFTTAHARCTWDVRNQELLSLIDRYG